MSQCVSLHAVWLGCSLPAGWFEPQWLQETSDLSSCSFASYCCRRGTEADQTEWGNTHTHTHRQVIWILSLGHRLELSSSWRKRCSVQCLLHTCGHLLTSSLAWSVLKWVWIRLLVSLLALRHYHIGGFTGRKHWLALAQRYPSSLHILGVVGKSKPVQCRVSMKAGAEAFQTAQGQQQCKCAYACLAVSVQCRDADALEQQDVLMHREEIKLLAVCISLAPQNVLFRVVNTG